MERYLRAGDTDDDDDDKLGLAKAEREGAEDWAFVCLGLFLLALYYHRLRLTPFDSAPRSAFNITLAAFERSW